MSTTTRVVSQRPCADSTPERSDYDLCIAAFHNRCGNLNHRPVVSMTLRAVSHRPGRRLELGYVWGSRVGTNCQTYPDMEDISLQGLAVPTFLKGIRDRNAAQEAMKFANPESIQEAVGQVMHIQGASRAFGN